MPTYDLTSSETRVLGCLLEKQRTTPDTYPLSLNSLRLACNQLTNRDPVVEYDEAAIRDALHRLQRRGFTRLASGAGSRTAKYRHLLADALPMTGGEQAVLCVLLLRGAQTPGELKQRSERMHAFAELIEVQETLLALIARGLAERLERRPGHKEERYIQLLQEREEDGDDEEPPLAYESTADGPPPPERGIAPTLASSAAASLGADAGGPGVAERVTTLEGEVAELRATIAELRSVIADQAPELQR